MPKLPPKFVAALPDWADSSVRISVHAQRIYITHPEHPPHFYNLETEKWETVILGELYEH